MKFFLDNCISSRLAEAIRLVAGSNYEHEVKHRCEIFPDRSIPDVDWIRELGRQRNWMIVSGDPRISRGRAEQEAWRESGLTAFFFGHGWAGQQRWKLAGSLIGWWPRIVEESQRAIPGSGYVIQLKAKELQLLYPPR